VITVGATDAKGIASPAEDRLAIFFASCTTVDGFLKPDLVAPGHNVIAPLFDKASTSYIAHPLHQEGDNHFRRSGTSMSTRVASGAVTPPKALTRASCPA
jgi:serine protease AprX